MKTTADPQNGRKTEFIHSPQNVQEENVKKLYFTIHNVSLPCFSP